MLPISLLLFAFVGRDAIAEPLSEVDAYYCPKHEHYVTEDVQCPKTCGNRLVPGQDTAGACQPYTGCVCDEGYVRPYDNATGPCKPVHKCATPPPECGANEVLSDCAKSCPPQSCESLYINYMCAEENCTVGCVCAKGYLRNSDGKCIPSKYCPKVSDAPVLPPPYQRPGHPSSNTHSSSSSQSYSSSRSYSSASSSSSSSTSITSSGAQKCSDKNAVFKECPSACPRTCKEPNPRICTKQCLKAGCECKPGYVLSEPGGKCIKPEFCPGESPTCTNNETYVNCKVGCPTNYCPVDDRRAKVACDPPHPCPSGCVCKRDYLRISERDKRCILASECPPVKCTRKHEVWDPQPSSCLAERCDDLVRQSECNKPYPYDRPACVCEQGYYRNKNDVCVHGSECLHCEMRNATFIECRTHCPATCADPDANNKPCVKICDPPGCQCNSGYVLTEAGGLCVLPGDCPGRCDDPNASFSDCPSQCPKMCGDTGDTVCILSCAEPGCVCNSGYVLSGPGGTCVLPENCPGRCDDPNASFSECPSACPKTCSDPGDRACIEMCMPPGCVCNQGYVLNADGKCVLLDECPGHCDDPNASFSDCPSQCPKMCGDTGDTVCILSCAEPGCVCNSGYVLSGPGGTCVLPENCPGRCDDPNASFSDCPSACPKTCNDSGDRACIAMCMPPGCVCNQGYVLNADGKCVLPENCPGRCDDPNASFSDCPSQCPKMCGDTGDTVCILSCAEPGCVCNSGYVLSGPGGTCVLPESCPGRCDDPNASFSECPSACLKTCNDSGDRACIAMCMPPGCVCNQGYVLNADGKCVLPDNCPGRSPTCPKNETYAYCKVGCPTNYCPVDDSRAIIACDPMLPCPSGCVCKSDYLRISERDKRCILASECPPVKCTRKHEVWDPQPSSCLAERCEDLVRQTECNKPYPYDRPACVCEQGYYRNKNDVCVHGSECLHCEMRNATFIECRTHCPATCADPDANNKPCVRICDPPGCQCNSGYVLTEAGGQCVLPGDCPGRCDDPNASFSDCPSQCPKMCGDTGDTVCILSCAEPGCVCNSGYVLSGPGGTCVLPENCPGRCDDPNASFSECPSACPKTCSDPGDRACIEMCMPPGCVCNQGYVLNADGKCVLPENCPGRCDDPNASFSTCPSQCPKMCGDTGDTVCILSCAEPGCVCNSGYVLSGPGGTCVLPENCPGRCDDPNASFSECPSACPKTCSDPGDRACILMCMPPGCVCNQGYVLNADGKCVLPKDCPVDEFDCKSHNATYKECRSACPARCSTINSGQKLYCPAVCREPGCECNTGFVLDDNERCIKPKDCPAPETCSIPKKCRRTCDYPNPPDCPYTPAKTNIDGCECQEGYILSEEGGKCIKIEECPSDQSCNGDPHARVKQCPPPCPSTCSSPDQSPCKKMCEPIGCVCESEYIYSEEQGKCVLPTDCPGGDPCGPTAMYSSCNFDCPHNICPQDDSREIILCKPPRDCPSGCVCKLNHKRLSYENRTCIMSSTCPPVDCTRPHEIWNDCPSECLAENCEDVNNQPTTCNTFVLNCQPKCICEKNHFRNGSDICIPAADCSKPELQCGHNEISVDCRTICPPQNCEIAYTEYACGETRCEPGCDCLPNHLRNGSGICVLNDDCPYPTYPICGINEIARDCRRICPPQTCQSKLALYRCMENIPCEAGCDCVANYLRDSNGVCIPSDECFATPTCSVPSECRRTCASPIPPNCPYKAAKTNIDGCDCQEGYILSEEGGPCIRIEDCPNDVGCNGDPHAKVKQSPQSCPSTCSAPDAVYCESSSVPLSCECTGGYILSKDEGKCVLPEQCPGGNPCGLNSRFVECVYNCPSDYCPVDDGSVIIACDPVPICLSGCICELNHKMLSYENNTCIVSSDCPPVECTRQNEVWSTCPECLAEMCSDADNPPSVCNTLVLNCQPKCICKEKHFRNSEGLCVSREECHSKS